MSAQYGELLRNSGWDRFGSLGHSSYFNGLRVLAALLHGSQVVSVSQTLRRWTEGATYIRQGDHHVGYWPTFLVKLFFNRQWPSFRVFCATLYVSSQFGLPQNDFRAFRIYTVSHKKGANLFLSVTSRKSVDFNAVFTVRFNDERYMCRYKFHPPHLTTVATLPCETPVSYTHLTLPTILRV